MYFTSRFLFFSRRNHAVTVGSEQPGNSEARFFHSIDNQDDRAVSMKCHRWL